MKKSIGIIFENYKELSELLTISRAMEKYFSISLQIISPSNVYNDKASHELLKKLTENEKVYYISAPSKKFNTLNVVEKIIYSLKIRKEIKHLFSDVDLVLSGVQTIFSRIMYKSSTKNNIPFFVYHRHLIFTTEHNSTNNVVNNNWVQRLLKLISLDEFFVPTPNVGFTDKYFVLGDLNSKYLEKHGIKRENIYITGSLEYDSISQLSIEKINNKKINIVYITSAFSWVNNKQGEINQINKINALIKYTKAEDNFTLTIRIHPRENFIKYEKLVTLHPFITLEYPTDKNIIQELVKYDIIIGWFSTAMFEISLLNKKVLFYCLENEKEEYQDIIDALPNNVVVNFLEKGLSSASDIDVSHIIAYSKETTSEEKIVKIIKSTLNA